MTTLVYIKYGLKKKAYPAEKALTVRITGCAIHFFLSILTHRRRKKSGLLLSVKC